MYRENNVQGLLLEEIQTAAPDAYARRTKRQGIVNAFMDENFAEAIRATGMQDVALLENIYTHTFAKQGRRTWS